MRDESYPEISFVPPQPVAKAAQEGLLLRATFRRGGTIVGQAMARELANRETLSPRTIRRMYSYFARHEVDKEGKDFENPDKPSNGRIAWMLWGGEPGKEWAGKVRAAMLAAR